MEKYIVVFMNIYNRHLNLLMIKLANFWDQVLLILFMNKEILTKNGWKKKIYN